MSSTKLLQHAQTKRKNKTNRSITVQEVHAQMDIRQQQTKIRELIDNVLKWIKKMVEREMVSFQKHPSKRGVA